MITSHRMGPKIWRIQRIKIPGITESKRKPLDYKTRQRVGIKPFTARKPLNTGLSGRLLLRLILNRRLSAAKINFRTELVRTGVLYGNTEDNIRMENAF